MTTMETNNLKLVFDHLINILQPIETKRIKNYYYDQNYYGLKKITFSTIINDCNYDNIKNIPEIEGYTIEVNNEFIFISNNNLKYQIATNQLLRVYNKINKTFK
jgi:hypothetical protein